MDPKELPSWATNPAELMGKGGEQGFVAENTSPGGGFDEAEAIAKLLFAVERYEDARRALVTLDGPARELATKALGDQLPEM